jgi:RHS repeat-associated protein
MPQPWLIAGSGGACNSCGAKSAGSSSSGGAPSGSGPGSSGQSGGAPDCPSCGMPTWWVSEPATTLWLKDTPMSYQPSHGAAMAFQLLFKSNPDQTTATELNGVSVFTVGQNWSTPWRSYLTESGSGVTNYAWVNGRGGLQYFNDNSGSYSNDYRDHTGLVISNGQPILKYASGAYDVFGYQTTGSSTRDFLTEKHDAQGNTNKFNWAYDIGIGVAYIATITDVDNKTTSFTYTNITTSAGTYKALYKATDAANHTTTLNYNQDSAQTGPPALTNIVDAAGISSSLQYTGLQPTTGLALTTPYGTTTFTVVTDLASPIAVHVNELGLRDHLFMYVGSDSTGQITNSYNAYVPTTTNFSNTFDTQDSDQRNTFYWGPRQYALLPAAFISDLTNASPSINFSNLYTTNYLQARQRHWLIDTNSGSGVGNLGQTLSLERDPSPDGVTQGQITWYDYDGKAGGNPEAQGTMIQPLFKAWKLPNGQSRFIRYERNPLGKTTRMIETYNDSGGGVVLRTNILVLASNNIDLLSMTNAVGVQVVSNVFDLNHQIRTNYNALGEKTVYTYDSTNRLLTVQTPAGLTTSNYYGADFYLAQTIDREINRTNSFTWTNGLVYSHTDSHGLKTTNTWDGLNRLVKITYPDGTYVTNIYSNLDLTRSIDRMGFTNRFEYNGFRQIQRSIDALNHTNTYGYCNCGTLSSITDPLNNSTTFSYDYLGRLTQTLYPDNYSLSYNYDSLGRVTNITDSAGASTTNWFNNQGFATASSNALGRVSTKIFDVLDRATNSIDANGVTVSATFDNLDRPLSRTYPDAGTEKFVYSANFSAPTSYTNQVGNTTVYTYDQGERKTNEVSVGISTNKFTYDGDSDLSTLVDGKSQTTTWNYDSFGRVTNKLDNLGTNLFTYTYDLNNRLTNRTSAAKGATVYKYDAAGNLTNVVYPISSNISLAYDAANHLVTMLDGVGTSIYSYDAAGQLLSEDGPFGSDTVTYAYNNRLRSSLSLSEPNGSPWVETYAYDAAKRLTNVTSAAGSFGYLYNSPRSLLPAKLSMPSGAYITNAYDGNARLLNTILKSSGGTTLNSHAYSYDLANQRTQQVFTTTNYINYTYDLAGQLTGAVGSEPGGTTKRVQEQFHYVYDPAGNLKYRTNDTLVGFFNVNSLNELTTETNTGKTTVAGSTTSPATNVTVTGPAGALKTATLYLDNTWAHSALAYNPGNNTFTAVAQDAYGRSDTNTSSVYLLSTNNFAYDANGNLLGDGRRAFDYDDENQLIRITVTNSWKSEFAYDGKMRRRKRIEFTWNGSGWAQTNEIHYVYDGNLVIQERNNSNLAVVSYTRGRDVSGSLQGAGGIGGVLARTDDSLLTHAYYTADGNGNITSLVNTNQQVAAKYFYDPYGNTISQSGPLADVNLYRFSSKEIHSNSGTYCYPYRYYDPDLQRWINRDPMAEAIAVAIRPAGLDSRAAPSGIAAIGTPFELLGGLNLFNYVENNPLLRVDPFGYSSVDATITAAEGSGDVDSLLQLLDENILNESQAARVNNLLEKFQSKATDWIAKKCKGSINREFPSQFKDKTLGEIKRAAKEGQELARKAWKLLNNKEYRK